VSGVTGIPGTRSKERTHSEVEGGREEEYTVPQESDERSNLACSVKSGLSLESTA